MVNGAFRHRGVIEGFYGAPWSHEDRLWCVERLGAWGMNRYVHAPKDDPLHRERWREAYPDSSLREFRELIRRADACGVQAGFAVSPGLSIRYADPADRRALCDKLRGFRELGARFLALTLDDVPSELVHEADRRSFASLGAAHVALANELHEALGPECTLWLVPTDYLGVEPTDYLEELGSGLAPEIEVGWTGRTVLSPTLEESEARARARTLRRPLLVWDNTPVSDGPMRNLLHLNPYLGRGAELLPHLSGVLLNPMQHARASGMTLRCAAHFLGDPQGYDAERAWRDAATELGSGAPDAFRLFALAHRFSPLSPDDRDRELASLLDALRAEVAAQRDARAALAALGDALATRQDASERLRCGLTDRRLAAEIEPWLASHELETRRMSAALECLRALLLADRARERVFAFFALEGRLSRTLPGAAASYGPRRALYPQLVSMRDDQMALSPEPTLVRDRCLADELVRWVEDLALERLRDSA